MKNIKLCLMMILALSLGQVPNAKADLVFAGVAIVFVGTVIGVGAANKSDEEYFTMEREILTCALRELGPKAFGSQIFGNQNVDEYPNEKSVLWRFYRGDNLSVILDEFVEEANVDQQLEVISLMERLRWVTKEKLDIFYGSHTYSSCGVHRPISWGFENSGCLLTPEIESQVRALARPVNQSDQSPSVFCHNNQEAVDIVLKYFKDHPRTYYPRAYQQGKKWNSNRIL